MGYNKNKKLSEEIVTHFKEKQANLRQQWIKKMGAKKLLEGSTSDEIEIESIAIYDTCVNSLATGNYDGAEKYAQAMAEKGVLRGMSTGEIIGGMLTLRDIYGRSLFKKYQNNQNELNKILTIYELMANKILLIVSMAFVEEKTKALEELTKDLEGKVKDRTKELQEKIKDLEKFNRFAIDRELRMVNLKKKIKDLEIRVKELEK